MDDASRPIDLTIRQRLSELRQPSVRDVSAIEKKHSQPMQYVQVGQPSVRDLGAIETKPLQIRQPL